MLLLCTGYGTALTAAPAPAFEFACSTAHGGGTAVISYRQFRNWSDRYAPSIGAHPMTTTRAVDPVSTSFSESPYYLSRQGDNGKALAQALYDPRHGILALCAQNDAWSLLSVVANVPPPPFSVIHADLAGIATKHGIHLGSTVAQVEAVYGRSRLVKVAGAAAELSYLRKIPMPRVSSYAETPEAVETWFGIVNGRVVSISLGTGF